MQSSCTIHLITECIFSYVKSTLGCGLHITPTVKVHLAGYTDLAWDGCHKMRRSTSGPILATILFNGAFVNNQLFLSSA